MNYCNRGRRLTNKESKRMHELEFFNTEIKIDESINKLFNCKNCIHYNNCNKFIKNVCGDFSLNYT